MFLGDCAVMMPSGLLGVLKSLFGVKEMVMFVNGFFLFVCAVFMLPFNATCLFS